MIYTELTEKALTLAYEVHKDQTDCCGNSVLAHLFYVADHVEGELAIVTALLHEVTRMTYHNIEYLVLQGFPTEVIVALQVLENEDNAPYERYIRRMYENPIAKAVKLADLEHNLDVRRIPDTEENRRYYEQCKTLRAYLLDDSDKEVDAAHLTGILTFSDDKLRDKIRGTLFGGCIGANIADGIRFYSTKAIEKRFPDGLTLSTNMEGIAEIRCALPQLFVAAGLLHWETVRYIDPKNSKDISSTLHYCLSVDFIKALDYIKFDPCTSLEKDLRDDDFFWDRSCDRMRFDTAIQALFEKQRGTIYTQVNNSKESFGLLLAPPIACYFKSGDRTSICRVAVEIAATTSGNPSGCLPAGVLCSWLSDIIHNGCKKASELLTNSKIRLYALYGEAYADELGELFNLLDKAVALSENNHSDKENIVQLGCGESADQILAISLYSMCKYDGYRDMVNIARYTISGDAAAVGMVAGAIAGARLGVSAIPKVYLADLQFRDVISRLSDDLCAGPRSIGQKWKRKYYWPAGDYDDDDYDE